MNDVPCSPASVLGILILFSLVKPLSAEHLLPFINTHFQSSSPAQSLTLRSHTGLSGLLSPSSLVFSYSTPTYIFQRNFESQDLQEYQEIPWSVSFPPGQQHPNSPGWVLLSDTEPSESKWVRLQASRTEKRIFQQRQYELKKAHIVRY